jgi:hypothetical protein
MLSKPDPAPSQIPMPHSDGTPPAILEIEGLTLSQLPPKNAPGSLRDNVRTVSDIENVIREAITRPLDAISEGDCVVVKSIVTYIDAYDVAKSGPAPLVKFGAMKLYLYTVCACANEIEPAITRTAKSIRTILPFILHPF